MNAKRMIYKYCMSLALTSLFCENEVVSVVSSLPLLDPVRRLPLSRALTAPFNLKKDIKISLLR